MGRLRGSDNPFSATYRVILDDVAMMPEIEPQLTAIPGVEEVMAPGADGRAVHQHPQGP